MTELINLFRKLSEFYDRNLLWENIEEIYEKDSEAQQNKRKQATDSQTAELSEEPPIALITTTSLTDLLFVQRTLTDPQVISLLLELCSAIRNLRGELSASYDNTYDCWDEVVKVSPRDSYLSFVYALGGLATLDPASATYTKLALAVVNTYFLSLTIPGAKGFHIFEPEVIAHCLQVFALIERIQQPEVVRRMTKQKLIEVWVRFSTFCDDLKLLLRYVHFSDHKATRDALLKKLVDIQYMNHERGYANMYAANLHGKCFEIFEEMVNAHNGEPEETLLKLMNMTVFLHTYPSKPKSTSDTTISGDCEHISDWFIKCISKYPRLLVKVLHFYIECIVTNPIKSWKTDQTQRALEYAAKYDAALFTKCNESSLEFLCDAVYADEVMIRSRAIELMSHILQLESQVDWQMFRHEVSDIPREVYFIKELIDSLQDCNNHIKLKAVQALHTALTKGSPNTVKILSEGIRFTQYNNASVKLPDEPRVRKNEIRYEKPAALTPQYSFEGHSLLQLAFQHLPEYVYKNLLHSPQSYIRRAGVMFMEQLVKLNPLIIFNTNFVSEMTSLVDEPTVLVRKQTLLSVDSILGCYPNCYPVVWVWCKIVAPMLHDGDPKNIELAMDCFRSRVLANIRGIDQSNKAEHFMPWVIIRTMLSTQPRLYLQTCFHMALQQRMVSSQILGIIESHLLTSNSTEAWIVLNFISGKIKSKEPDALIHLFISLKSWNKEQNMLIALEVLANCIQDFSHTALNHVFNHILNQIRDGQIIPVLIGKAFDLLVHIDNCSQVQACKNNSKSNTVALFGKSWLLELHELLEVRIHSGIADFPDNHATFMSHLYSYSEVNLQTRARPHRTIIAFVHRYMSECVKLPESELHLENERLFNSMILIAGRFSLRDAETASTSCTLYASILRAIDRPPIVNTIIISLIDLCKKHTQIVERIIEHVLAKLTSPYVVNRIETFKCFEKLVLQDQLKLRGSLLLGLMATILDENAELSTRASDFFAEFLNKKNSTLFQKCLVECPFVFNEYKNFDGLDSFSDTGIKSYLKGEEKRKSRQMLYNHLMASIDDIHLLLYFGQLKLISEKSIRDPTMKSSAGLALLKDVLFILKRVCHLIKEQKPNTDNKDGEGENKTDDSITEINASTSIEESFSGKGTTAATTATANTGRGRGRRREVTTMADALNLVEKSLIFVPTIYDNVNARSDEQLQKAFDDLGQALAKRFPNLVQYAQPAEFWHKYRNSIVSSGTAAAKQRQQKKKHKMAKEKGEGTHEKADANSTEIAETIETDEDGEQSEELECDSAADSNFSSDEEFALASKPVKRFRLSGDELPMEYLFNPNI